MIFKTDSTEAKLLQLEEFAEMDAVLATKAKNDVRNERFVINLIEKYVDTARSDCFTFAVNNHDDAGQLADDFYRAIIHFKRVNNFHFINKQFEAINTKLPVGVFLSVRSKPTTCVSND